MNDHDLAPLDDDIRGLLERTRPIEAAPSTAKAHVLARVSFLATLPAASTVGASGTSDGLAGSARVRTASRVGPLSAAFVFGTIVGALAVHSIDRRRPEIPERVDQVERPSALAMPSADVPAVPVVPASVPSPPPRLAASQVSTHPATPSNAEGTLAAERALLDGARSAIEREDGAAALALVNEHKRRFRNGFLVQERDAMAIRALSLLGRADEARAGAAKFRARFPDSLLWPAIESTLESLPQ